MPGALGARLTAQPGQRDRGDQGIRPQGRHLFTISAAVRGCVADAPSHRANRGGPSSAAHVDILANHELLADVVALAAGHPEAVQERVLSYVDAMAGAMWRSVLSS